MNYRLSSFLHAEGRRSQDEGRPAVRVLHGPRTAPPFVLENRTGYDDEDLRRFIACGLAATSTWGKRGEPLRVVVSASPIRSRGCAEVGGSGPCSGDSCPVGRNGSRLILAIAAPWRFELRRFARLLEHEAAHVRGYEHEMMDHELLLSLGPIPEWATRWFDRGGRLRYWGRAPDQLPFLRR